ncbi:ABC transporter ATP-binding protein [Lapidilactobacillus achengensis]|uniref:ABC transporter ATP-binding protein n=1 Tax=Lapidilactobacillus achengensis TaxID=2486000 RepID=A0ABW1UNR8_9LACO|nr:ABC transporter ATP-binding protein [Lapidilactobacillus achengensis]
MTEIKVRINHISKVYENGDGIRDIDLEIRNGEILTLLGPSGCGKSTILRCLGGFQGVDSGHILIDGQDVTELPANKRPTSMVFQSYNLWDHMTVYENLAFGLKLRKMAKSKIREKITAMLQLLRMPEVVKKYPSQLSGGQQQRIAIGRSLLLEPSVLLLDEPYSALDAKIRQQMREELKRIQRETGVTVAFVTHDQEEAMALSDRIVVMDKGSIAQIDTPQNIYENPINRYTASFIGEMNFLDQGLDVQAFRPEDATLSAEHGDFLARIDHVSSAGHYGIITLTYQEQPLKIFVDKVALAQYQPHQQVYVTVNKAKTYGAPALTAGKSGA